MTKYKFLSILVSAVISVPFMFSFAGCGDDPSLDTSSVEQESRGDNNQNDDRNNDNNDRNDDNGNHNNNDDHGNHNDDHGGHHGGGHH